MSSTGLEHANPASERPRNHALDRVGHWDRRVITLRHPNVYCLPTYYISERLLF